MVQRLDFRPQPLLASIPFGSEKDRAVLKPVGTKANGIQKYIKWQTPSFRLGLRDVKGSNDTPFEYQFDVYLPKDGTALLGRNEIAKQLNISPAYLTYIAKDQFFLATPKAKPRPEVPPSTEEAHAKVPQKTKLYAENRGETFNVYFQRAGSEATTLLARNQGDWLSVNDTLSIQSPSENYKWTIL